MKERSEDEPENGRGSRGAGRGGSGAKGSGPRRDPARYGRAMKSVSIWFILMLILLVAHRVWYGGRVREVEISYSQFMTEVRAANVKSVIVMEKEVRGHFTNPTMVETPPMPAQQATNFKVFLPAVDPQLPEKIWAHNPAVEVSSRPPGVNWLSLFFSWLPILLILGLYARIGAAVIMVNMLFALLLAHRADLFLIGPAGGWALELQGFFLFTALSVVLMGPGRYSVNNR